MKLLLDEMYSQDLAGALTRAGLDAVTAAASGLSGSSDFELFAAAIADGRAILTENVGDFARIAAGHLTAGRHHPGVLVALSSRFSRRPGGRERLVAAILAPAGDSAQDLVLYLRSPSEP